MIKGVWNGSDLRLFHKEKKTEKEIRWNGHDESNDMKEI